MSMLISPNDEIKLMQWKTALQTKNLKLPHAAAQKLKAILTDDQIKPEEFIAELNKIMDSTNTLNWKTILYLTNLRDRIFNQVTSLSWVQVGLFLCAGFLVFFLVKNYSKNKQVKKISKRIYTFFTNIATRIFAFLGYSVATFTVFNGYLPYLQPRFRFFIFLTPPFMADCLDFYSKNSVLNYFYFFGLIYIVVVKKLPKNRFIRFHLVRGLSLYALLDTPMRVSLFFLDLCTEGKITPTQFIELQLAFFVAIFILLISCYIQALTLSYPKNELVRDAIEIMLGRDNTDGFKWWNRKK